MFLVRGRRLEDDLAEGRLFEPMGNLPAENPGRLRDRAVILAAFAFAGDDQDEPLSLRVASEKECEQGSMRAIDGHAMKIDAGVRAGLTAFHPREGLPVHAKRLVRSLYSCLGGWCR